MPFLAQPEEQFEGDVPLIQSDIPDDATATTEQELDGDMPEAQLQREQQEEPGTSGATVAAIVENEEDEESDDDEEIPNEEEAPLPGTGAQGEVPTPTSTKKRGKSSQSKTPRSAKSAPASGSRKRKATDSNIAVDTDVTPAKRGRPARDTVAPSARLAAKAASKPARGRPKVTASATSTKPSRGRPKSTATSTVSTSKTPATAKGKRGRPKHGADGVPEDEWEVETIVDSGIDADTSEHRYLVKWKGYSAADNTWEPKSNLSHCMDLVRKFDTQHKPRTKGGDGSAIEPKEPKKRGRKPKSKA